MKKALITGVSGQDGSWLADLLVSKGYEVHGLIRRTSVANPRLALLPKAVRLHEGNLSDLSSLLAIQREVAPAEVYHLAAESQVGRSFKEPLHTMQITGMGAMNMLEAVRLSGIHSRVYLASTSEMFGGRERTAYNELSRFSPRSPYGAAKLAAHSFGVNYREAFQMFVSCGILFNHESERRGADFVTRKITLGIARILRGEDVTPIRLGNLQAARDWGYAPDYVEGMWRILQASQASDYVLATGEAHTIQEFLAAALYEAGVAPQDRKKFYMIDPTLYRPAEVDVLIGDASKAKRELGWQPKTSFRELVRNMVANDMREAGLTWKPPQSRRVPSSRPRSPSPRPRQRG